MDNKHLIENIERLKKEKNAAILGHFYQRDEIQDISDFVGDSLAMAQWAAKCKADILVVCGVYFMAETAKIICPDKKVLIPDDTAGCTLADGCRASALRQWKEEHPDYTIISYVNTTAAVKALTDVVVTSSNAKQIVESFPADEKILFGPDRNLGAYINKVTGRHMELWDASCRVHEQYSAATIKMLKNKYPHALVLAHPECRAEVLELSDVIGSTAKILKTAIASDNKQFIVATEAGILHQMKKAAPDKEFIPVPPEGKSEGCVRCLQMQLNTLDNLYKCLLDETPEVHVNAETAAKAKISIERMLDISQKLGL